MKFTTKTGLQIELSFRKSVCVDWIGVQFSQLDKKRNIFRRKLYRQLSDKLMFIHSCKIKEAGHKNMVILNFLSRHVLAIPLIDSKAIVNSSL